MLCSFISRSDTNRTVFTTELNSKDFHDWRQMAKEHDAPMYEALINLNVQCTRVIHTILGIIHYFIISW